MTLDREIIEAIRLANAGDFAEALMLLEAMTQQYPYDFRPWWAIAHLSQDTARSRIALEQVLMLNPDHNEAQEMLAKLRFKV